VVLIRLKRQVLVSQRSSWLWATRTDISAAARFVLAAPDSFSAWLVLALLPLVSSFDVLLCRSEFAFAL